MKRINAHMSQACVDIYSSVAGSLRDGFNNYHTATAQVMPASDTPTDADKNTDTKSQSHRHAGKRVYLYASCF